METVVIFAIAGCLFSGAVVYVVLDYHRHGERQEAMEGILGVKAEVLKTKKTLLGYTKYLDYLPQAKQMTLDKIKSVMVKFAREHIVIEKIQTDEKNPKATATIIFKYLVEYSFGFELKPENLDIAGTTSGIEVRVIRPTLMGAPFVKSHSYEIPSGGALEDEKVHVKEIQDKLPEFARQHGLNIGSEATTRALCEKKLVELVADFLMNQSGVTQVPVIAVVYK